MSNILENQKGFTMVEIAIVLMAIAFIAAGIMGSRSLISSSRISNAQNLTANSPVPNIDGLAFWMETSMDTKKVNVNDNVDTLQGIGPSRLTLLQKTMPKVPIYGESTILRGLKTLEFDGSNACLATTPINAVRYSIFVVLNPGSIEPNDVIVQNGSGTTGWEILESELTSETRMVTVVNTSSNRNVYINNGTPTTPLNVDATVFKDFLTIGCGNGSNGFAGEIAEVIIYNRDLFADEIATVHEYLQKKYLFNY